ncbi:MAG: long-chain fatty acid--CoA ligase [Trueperaceae bacterium]|nr:MAG: long-chain fatty acid--CoA ligase [Trueperaceae bacterium]
MNSTMMDVQLLITGLLERAGHLYADEEIVSQRPDKSLHRMRYRDFYRRSKALAGALTAAGLAPGSRVATLMWNHYAHLEAYFGVPAGGFVVHTLNLRLHPSDLAYIATHAGDEVLIVDDVLLPLYQAIAGHVEFKQVLVVPTTGAPVAEPYTDYEAFLETCPQDYAFPELRETEAAAMCYTSGTTGRPKGVLYSHRSTVLHAFALGLTDTIGITRNDVVVPVVPQFHAMAWGLPYACAMVGAKQVLPGPHLDPESLLDLFDRERVTYTAGVPTIWLGIAQALESQPARWTLTPGLRMAVGGAAAPPSLIRALDRHDCTVIHAWGMTETSPLGTVSVPGPEHASFDDDGRVRVRAKQGRPAPFVEIRVVNDQGIAPWDGKTMGELEVRGPWVAAGYYGDGEGSEAFTEDGWFRTGDVATIDSSGFVEITDRTKDLIKSGGEWISSLALENALMGHETVAEAAVVGIPHPSWQERPLAVVVPHEGREADPAALRSFLETQFAKWWLPDEIIIVDTIPRTSTGKFQKRELKEAYRDRYGGLDKG